MTCSMKANGIKTADKNVNLDGCRGLDCVPGFSIALLSCEGLDQSQHPG